MKDLMECDWETLGLIDRMVRKAKIEAMTECLGIASRHAAAEFVERDIRERIERLEAKGKPDQG